MEALRIPEIVQQDGEIHLKGLPYKKGQRVEIILWPATPAPAAKSRLTARRLLNSGLIGLWRDRDDIEDSAAYARQLWEQAQRRDRG